MSPVKRETVEQRKALPLATGLLDYFPDALLVVAEVSRVGNEQHHPGEPLHWDKSKSTDEADALMRHLVDRGTLDVDGLRHTGKVAWRALALLQRELDAEAEAEAGRDHYYRAGQRVLTPAEVQDEVLKGSIRGMMDSLGIKPTCHYQHGDLSMCGLPHEAHVHQPFSDSHEGLLLSDVTLDHHHHVFNPEGR